MLHSHTGAFIGVTYALCTGYCFSTHWLPVIQTVADLKVVMVLLHLVLDLLIQKAQFHHEDQTGHAGEPVPPHLQYSTIQCSTKHT